MATAAVDDPFDPFDPFPVLETERLVLRAFRTDDAPTLLSMFGDPEVMRYWGSPRYTSLDAAHDLLGRIDAAYRERRGIEWGVTLRTDGTLIGKVCHHRWVREHFRAEIGYAIGRQQWGRGLGVEAVRAILDFGFTRMGLHSVEAQIDPDNRASVRTVEKLGFVREGHLRQNFHFDGRFFDTLIYSLLRSA